MQILSVVLNNFKTHRDQSFEFLPGTNAICGENGAGKTSILEAIAWTLFNYKGSYKVEDLIRNGAASAQVRVRLISSADSRTYEVQRCSQRGYQIYDPQLQARLDLSRIEEDVLPWLRQHLGVPPGTDLARLFANTIGVPQGTFTADFLKSPSDRKKTFDTTLKVEAYRQVYEGLAPLEKYAKAEVEKLEQAIAHFEEALADWEPLSSRQQDLQQQIQQIHTEQAQTQQQLQALEQERQQLSHQTAQIQSLRGQLEAIKAQIQAQTQLVDRLEQERQQTAQAVAICQAQATGYQTFLASEAALRELEQQRQQHQALLEQRQLYREQLAGQQANWQTLTQQRQRLEALQAELAQLTPLIQEQTHLEQQLQTCTQQLQGCQGSRQQAEAEQKRRAQLTERLAAVQSDLKTIAKLKAAVDQIPELETQQQRAQRQLSRVEVARQFEQELRQLLATIQGQSQEHQGQIQQAQTILEELQTTLPFYTDSLRRIQTALSTGNQFSQQFIQALEEILADLSSQTSPPALTQQLQQLQGQLHRARQQQAQVLRRESLIAEQTQLTQDIQVSQAALQEYQAALAAEPDWQRQQAQLSAKLTRLEDPRSRQRFYQQELQQYPQLQQQCQRVEASRQQTQEAFKALESQLKPFASLAAQIQQHQEQCQATRSAYQGYLEHQQLANRHKTCKAELEQALTQKATLETEGQTRQQTLQQAEADYDSGHHHQVEAAFKQAEIAQVSLAARLPEIDKRLQDLEIQLAQLQRTQVKRDRAQQDLKTRAQARHFITFARKSYKQAGPRITERYVQQISREADRLFRELLNRPNLTLEWTRDYDIVVQEGAQRRRFVNLSGGEQMCAALAVRLALLKVLATLDIAFFDEPTTNMDRVRREQLAEAIANIKTFHQLFVISHDDTFEKVTGNVVLVERPET